MSTIEFRSAATYPSDENPSSDSRSGSKRERDPRRPGRIAFMVSLTALSIVSILLAVGYSFYRIAKLDYLAHRPAAATRVLLQMSHCGDALMQMPVPPPRKGEIRLAPFPPILETWVVLFTDNHSSFIPELPVPTATPASGYITTPGLGKFGRPHPPAPPVTRVTAKADWNLTLRRPQRPYRDFEGHSTGWEVGEPSAPGGLALSPGIVSSSSSTSSGNGSVFLTLRGGQTPLPNHFADFNTSGESEVTGTGEATLGTLPLFKGATLTGTIHTNRLQSANEPREITGMNGSRIAIQGGGIEIVKVRGELTVRNLIAMGADPNAREVSGTVSPGGSPANWGVMGWMNPIGWKTWWDNRNKKEYTSDTVLISLINFAGPFSYDPHIRPGSIEMVKEILDAHADPNLPGAGNRLPLSNAIQWNSVEVVKLLMQHGANPRLIADVSRKRTPIDEADERVRMENENYERAMKIKLSEYKVTLSGTTTRLSGGRITGRTIWGPHLSISGPGSSNGWGISPTGSTVIYGHKIPGTGAIPAPLIEAIRKEAWESQRAAAQKRMDQVRAMRAALDQPVVPFTPSVPRR